MKPILKPLLSITRVSFFCPSGVKIGDGLTGHQMQFPRGSEQSLLVHDSDGVSIWFGIANDIYDTKHFKLSEGPYDLSREELIELSTRFDFEVQPNPIASEYLTSRSKDSQFNSGLMGAIQKHANRFYLLIYVKAGTTDFEDDLIFVHGIWQVSISEDFKNRIYR